MFQLKLLNDKRKLPTPDSALPGRPEPLHTAQNHFVTGVSLKGPFPSSTRKAMFGLGCFWGAERKFWELEGVYATMVGYSAGHTPNPTYQEVCSGMTGHNEVVQVVYDPATISYSQLLSVFWESHDPTQGMRQGNDVGTQYRSGIYVFDDDQRNAAIESRKAYEGALAQAGLSSQITTEIRDASPFYFAEEYHQQYLAKNPQGYCGLGGTGVSCPLGPPDPVG